MAEELCFLLPRSTVAILAHLVKVTFNLPLIGYALEVGGGESTHRYDVKNRWPGYAGENLSVASRHSHKIPVSYQRFPFGKPQSAINFPLISHSVRP